MEIISLQQWIGFAGFLVRSKCHPVFLQDLLSDPIWPHMHMLTHAETHTHLLILLMSLPGVLTSCAEPKD